MKITEKDLYSDDKRVNICPIEYRGKKPLFIFIKPLNSWVRLTALVNHYLKQEEVK